MSNKKPLEVIFQRSLNRAFPVRNDQFEMGLGDG